MFFVVVALPPVGSPRAPRLVPGEGFMFLLFGLGERESRGNPDAGDNSGICDRLIFTMMIVPKRSPAQELPNSIQHIGQRMNSV